MEDREPPAGGGQREFDFWQRDRLIAGVCLPRSVTVADRSASSFAVKAVLFRIHQHAGQGGESFPGIATLAKQTELHERTVRTAIQALAQLGLITIARKKSARSYVVCNHYAICWEEILQRQSERYKGHPETQGERAPCPDQPGIRAGASGHNALTNRASGHKQPGMVPTEPSMEPLMNKSMEREVGGVSKSGGATLKAGLTTDDLADPETVLALWDLVMASRRLPDTPYWRETFMALCYSLWRNRSRIRNPVGLLHHKLDQGQQAVLAQVDDEHDRAWAHRVIRQRETPTELLIRESARSDPPSPDPARLQAQLAAAFPELREAGRPSERLRAMFARGRMADSFPNQQKGR